MLRSFQKLLWAANVLQDLEYMFTIISDDANKHKNVG